MASLEQVIASLTRLDEAIRDALANEVADAAREAIRDAAMSEVYSYTPGFYSRRMASGGLIDEANIITTVEGNTLTVDNVTGLQNLWGEGDTGLLTPIVEAGLSNYNMPYPRPFMEVAEAALRGGKAAEALARGLARQGIDMTGGFTLD